MRGETKFLGGVPEAVPRLGRRGALRRDVRPLRPQGEQRHHHSVADLQQVAEFQAYGKVRDAPLGSEEQIKAMQALTQTEKGDPFAAGLPAGDATQGALAVIKQSSKNQGTQHETDPRAMAQALARKLLEKL